MPIEYFDDPIVGSVAQPDPIQRRAHPTLRRRLTHAGQQLEVLPAGEVGVEPGLVDDGADPGQRPVAVLRHLVAEQRHGAGVGVGQPEQHPDEGRLAGAVRARDSRTRTLGAPSSSTPSTAVFGPNRLVRPWVSTAHSPGWSLGS